MSVTRARGLRRRQTEAERRLWSRLRARALDGWKFRRQHPVGPYVLDFVCEDARLAIEIDGGQHADRSEQDQDRTVALERHGYRVIRFWNNEVLDQTDAVLETIFAELRSLSGP